MHEPVTRKPHALTPRAGEGSKSLPVRLEASRARATPHIPCHIFPARTSYDLVTSGALPVPGVA